MAKRSNARDTTPSSVATTQSSNTATGSTPLTTTNTTATTTMTTPISPSKTSLRPGTTTKTPQTAQDIALGMWQNYADTTPQRMKMIDVFMAFLVVVGVLQFTYCVIAGNYPFNAFLSGFGATVGQFVLTASLRIQTNEENKAEFHAVSPERAFADYVLGSLILHFFCVNFIN